MLDILKNDRVINLSKYIKKNENLSNLSKEARDLVEKPFAMITLIAKIELENKKNTVVIKAQFQ